ncbi:MAG: hypothetical protein KDM64_09920, partial [Verrucomicrobiae bacterium]|nr:hypothetical protein [Verrucomicrobiae bacterium]
MNGTIRSLVYLWLALWSLPIHADTNDRLATLRSGFDAALGRLDESYRTLDEAYHGALTRLLESETKAGELDHALAVKGEIEAFAANAVFDAATMEKRLSSFDALKRLQTTYLEQRRTVDRQMDPHRKDLASRFDEELSKLQTELTKAGRLEEAVAAKTAQAQFRVDPRFAAYFDGSGDSALVLRGKIRFVTKGELELYLNGEALDYRNEYQGDDAQFRITGETKGTEDFRKDDLLVIRGRSTATFRGIIATIVSEDGTSILPIRSEQLRYIGAGKDAKSLTADKVKPMAQGFSFGGGTDGIMVKEWDKMKIP